MYFPLQSSYLLQLADLYPKQMICGASRGVRKLCMCGMLVVIVLEVIMGWQNWHCN
jgi:hypothetical protein